TLNTCTTQRVLLLAGTVGSVFAAAAAQQPPPPWQQGRPEAAGQSTLAPVAPPPIPTAVDAEVIARGIRQIVGMDFRPGTNELYFTENGRDWLSEDAPEDKLNRWSKLGQHFGYPFCHQGNLTDNEFGWGRSCDDFTKPVTLLGPHAAPLGMRF